MLENAWYIAAWADEVAAGPVGRTVLGRPLVFYRTESGAPVALGDVCPHRNAPLSLGKVCGSTIQCRYHGFRFGVDGACVEVASQAGVPDALRTPSYPVLERYGAVWVWVGDPTQADTARLPDWPWATADGFLSVPTYVRVEAPYEFILDNVMDLTHVHFLHRLLGSDMLVHTGRMAEVEHDEHTVKTARAMAPPREGEPYFEIGSEYRPPQLVTWGRTRHSQVDELAPGPSAFVLHCPTPVDEQTTDYYGVLSFNSDFVAMLTPDCDRSDPDAMSAAQKVLADITIVEDKLVCEEVWRLKQLAPERTKDRLVRADKPGALSRRMHNRLQDEEAGAPSDVPVGVPVGVPATLGIS